MYILTFCARGDELDNLNLRYQRLLVSPVKAD
jgi:hypothetical protein